MSNIDLSNYSSTRLLQILHSNDQYVIKMVIRNIFKKDNFDKYYVFFACPRLRSESRITLEPKTMFDPIVQPKDKITIWEKDVNQKISRQKLEHAIRSKIPIWINLIEYLR